MSPSSTTKGGGGEDLEVATESPVLVRTSSLLRSMSSSRTILSSREYAGMLEKQKETMKTWPQRYCWVKDGKMSWAEPSKAAASNKQVVKAKGDLLLSEITAVERTPTVERPRQFVVKTDGRTINFAAPTDEELEAWLEVLSPEAASFVDDVQVEEEEAAVLRRFTARLVRSEEVVVTVRPNLAVEVSKYVGGGFRQRIDELRPSARVEVDASQAVALGLPADDPLCVVARGGEAWSTADGGVCFLAMSNPDARSAWADASRAVEARAAESADVHDRLAGWKLAPQWWQLFDGKRPELLVEVEAWLRSESGLRSSDPLRFPTRYAPPPYALRNKAFLAIIAVPCGGPKVRVSCVGGATLDEFLAELGGRLSGRAEAVEVAATLTQHPEICALRLAGIRSYICRRDAPLLASADFVKALRDSIKPVATVGLVLEIADEKEEAALLRQAHDRLAALGDKLLLSEAPAFPTKELAATLRERTPNVGKLAAIPDATLEPLVPQLVQALKREPAMSLVQFLLRRALENPVFFGASLFWALRSEMSRGGETAVVHGCLNAAYLAALGPRGRTDLEKQVVLDAHLRAISKVASSIDDRRIRTSYAQSALRKLLLSGELPAGMDLPCLPGRRAGAICPEHCRVLSSKAAPIILAFEDVENGRDFRSNDNDDKARGPMLLKVIFKTRDDLRQDAAMLQSIRTMDLLWLQAGHECWLRTYSVTATGVDAGWIEVVPEAKETSEIQSANGAFGAFQKNTLKNFLEKKNDDSKTYDAARARFEASCAACCVATYVLGIADRHNGNIMLSGDGRLFHIDYGHVLGNFKKLKALNIKREKTKLVLTPEMMFVINQGADVAMNAAFEKLCCSLIGVLREQGNSGLLVQLLKELIPAKLPEIDEDSIKWLVTTLQKPDADLRSELNSALTDWVRRLDNANHNRIHQLATSQRAAKNTADPSPRRVSTTTDALHEAEVLRRKLTEAEVKIADLTKQLRLLESNA